METREYTAEQESELLARTESHFLDFKRAAIKPGKLQETLVALANADGGEVVIGLDDDVSKPAAERFFAFKNEEAANQHISTLDSLIEPPIPGLSAEFIRCPTASGRLLLHLIVPKSPNIHYTSDKVCYVRKGAQNLAQRGKAIERLVFSKGQRSFEDVPVETVRAKELARSDYMQQYLRLVPTAQPAEIFLRKQRLTAEDQQGHFAGSPVITAAVLLFDDSPQAALPTKCSIKVTRLETTEEEYRREFLKGTPITIEGPLQLAIERAEEAVLRIMRGVTFNVAGRYEALRYPPVAIHEIVTNAVLHRDYAIKDDIRINIYDNRIEVISPGRLPGHITLSNILEERYARNPKIVRLLNKLPDPPNKDIGEGLETTFRSMRDARLKPPVIEELENSVRVTLRHESIASAEEQIVEYLELHGTIRNSDARRLTGIGSENAMKRIFERMRKNQLIEPVDSRAAKAKYSYKLLDGYEGRFQKFKDEAPEEDK
jgi:ATP-dependent DNA helicase RecG